MSMSLCEDPRSARLPVALAAPTRVADALVSLLIAMGVEAAFGVLGGAVVPLADALKRSGQIDVIHTRHESGAAFAAAEASLASGRPAVVFTTTGPGITNALTGLFVARREGARVILLSGATAAPQRDRGAFQESGPSALPGFLYATGPLFDYATVIEHPDQIEVTARRLARGLRRPQGFVAHVAVTTPAQSLPVRQAPRLPGIDELRPEQVLDPADVIRAAELLGAGRSMLWVGHGARRAAELVRAVAERLGAPVMSTPRGKGIFPETHALYTGVTGLGGHEGPRRAVREISPDHILVLGSRLGEMSSGWDPGLSPRRSFLHVDVDPAAPGLAYPGIPTLGIHAEIGAFLAALLPALPERAAQTRYLREPESRRAPAPRRSGPVRPQALFHAIQRLIVEQSDAVVIAEAGNSFVWASHLLRFDEPLRYRTNLGWGSMGHATAGVLGAALGRTKAVAIVGDGAMLMGCEVSTAAQYMAPAVWIVLNDAQYGMVERGMRDWGYEPVETAILRADFAAMARSMGAEGIRVDREEELDVALCRAMRARGPFVVDVSVDPAVTPALGSRIDNLREQGDERG